MKAIILISSLFVLSSLYSQSKDCQIIDSVHISKVTLNVTIENIGKKTFPIDLGKFLEVQNPKLYNQITNARTSVSLIIDSKKYYAPLLKENISANRLLNHANSIIKAQLLKLDYYRNGEVETYYLFVDFEK